MFRNRSVSRSPNRKTSLLLLLAVTLFCARAASAGTQDAPAPDDRIKALEHERDELKKRNSLLELRLRQLQTSIDRTVTETLDTATLERTKNTPPAPNPPGEPAAKEAPVAGGSRFVSRGVVAFARAVLLAGGRLLFALAAAA